MDNIKKFVSENKERFIEELKDYIKIPSISTDPERKDDVKNCAIFVENMIKKAGIEKTRIYETDGHPIVYGEWEQSKELPTVLIYGHYDVQPVDPLDLWETPPFEGIVKDGEIFARGANDNKGQNFVHIKSIETLFSTENGLPVNIKFVIEGEEEIGSGNLYKFLEQQSELLKCDAVLISDTSLYAKGIPTIGYGLRGLAYLEVEVRGANRDLHSGAFGGAVANPINELSRMISKLINEDGVIQIPGMYDDVIELTDFEKKNITSLNFSDEEFMNELELKSLKGEKGYNTLERLWARPTLDVNGIFGGYTGQGAKTVLPAKATAKISMRLVPNQDPEKISKLFKDYLNQIKPDGVTIEVRELHGGNPVVISLNTKAVKDAAEAMKEAFGKETVFTREGGSIPIVLEFAEKLNAPVVLMGLGLDSDNIHSPNEHFSLDHFEKGILSSAYFLKKFGVK